MNKLNLEDVLSEYNVDFSKAQAFFIRNDLGMIISPDVTLSEEQYNAFCRRFKSKKKEENSNKKDNSKTVNTRNTHKQKIKLTNDKDALIKAFLSGYETEVLSFYAPFNTCLNVLTVLYKLKESKIGIYSDLSLFFKYPYSFKYSDLFSKRLTVNNKTHYYYYNERGNQDLIIYKSLATLIICLLSEAVNQNKISMSQYQALVKKYFKVKGPLTTPPEKHKKNRKAKQWYSVVSVPFVE